MGKQKKSFLAEQQSANPKEKVSSGFALCHAALEMQRKLSLVWDFLSFVTGVLKIENRRLIMNAQGERRGGG